MARWKRGVALASLGLMLWCPLAMGSELALHLTAEAWVDALIAGLDISADLGGCVHIAGEFSADSVSVPFSAEGILYGFGIRSLLTITTEGWVVLDATGATEDGRSVSFRSLLYAKRQSLIPLQVDDPIETTHFTILIIEDLRHVLAGSAIGTVVGDVVPSGKAMTIRLEGTGAFDLTGVGLPDQEVTAPGDLIPLEYPQLPADFLASISQLFGGRSCGVRHP